MSQFDKFTYDDLDEYVLVLVDLWHTSLWYSVPSPSTARSARHPGSAHAARQVDQEQPAAARFFQLEATGAGASQPGPNSRQATGVG